MTHTPEPGDIGYQAKPFQHHFVVEFAAGQVVHSIDGNQPDVARRSRTVNSGLTFYSIEPLLGTQCKPRRPTVAFGSAGELVAEWQDVLFRAGYPRMTDGKFGSQTLLYTKLYQLAHGLRDDGIVGPDTWATVEEKS